MEYLIDGIAQCSINPKINLTFEETLRHIVRQDPDVIVIGEIRDNFSAEIAVQAALTGHKVLTTFHTEDSIGGLIRLLNMNIEAFLVSSTVVSVLAQRLLRRVCGACGVPEIPRPGDLQRLAYTAEAVAGARFMKGQGCSECGYNGYKGRVGVYELLVLDEMVRNALIEQRTSHEIRTICIESTGLVTLVAHRGYFRTKDPLLQRRMNDLWRHSVACAIGAKWLAEKGGFDLPANEAFFAGLLHDVGKLFIITVLEKLKKAKEFQRLPSEALIDEILNSLHGKHGYAIMHNWNLPEKYCLIARDHHQEEFDTDNLLLCIVRQANWTCHKVGIGLQSNSSLVLSATQEAGLLGVTDMDMAKLEIHLEDAKLLAA